MNRIMLFVIAICFLVPVFSIRADGIDNRLHGRILLQVEKAGEAWYISPDNGERYFMGRPADAFLVMRSLGLGISNKDISKIGIVGEVSSDKNLARRLAGKILLQVEENGEAWYINPVDYKKYFLGRPVDAFSLMRSKGLGITNVDLDKIAVAEDSLLPYHRPKLELFVMSLCPYGLQMQKGILPVVRLLGEKIDFEIKFVNYIMHGLPEISENINQYCIDKIDKNKYFDYLDCYVGSGDSGACFSGLGISSSILGQCIDQVDEEYQIMNSYNDSSSWKGGRFPKFGVHDYEVDKYEIFSSPTLMIDGDKYESKRDSNSLLKSICSYFDNEPEECQQELSTVNPSPGFGYYGSESSGSCS